jgi:hypothetical protein
MSKTLTSPSGKTLHLVATRKTTMESDTTIKQIRTRKRIVKFCDALKIIQANQPNSFTDGSAFRVDDIGTEVDFVSDVLHISNNTSDGVDLHYFLLQYKFTNYFGRAIGLFSVSAMSYYSALGSAASSYQNGTVKGWLSDVSGDEKGNVEGYNAASIGLSNYISKHCG